MNTSDLIARARMSAFIGDVNTFPDYTDAWILNELNDQLHILFSRCVVNAKQGYWLKRYIVPVTTSTATFRTPQRAVAGGMKRLDISYDASLQFCELNEVADDYAYQYTLGVGQTGQPRMWVMRGDSMVILPFPDNSTYNLLVSYYLRPPLMYLPQSSDIGGTNNGQITSVNYTTRVVTFATLPFNQALAVPINITSEAVDIVRGTGWHEVQLVSAPQTYTGSGPYTMTLGGTDDMSSVLVGDYVRVADQSDWPALPNDFARCLADATAIKVLTELNINDKAAAIAQGLTADLERFLDLLSPRVQDTGGRDIHAPMGLYRGTGRSWQVK